MPGNLYGPRDNFDPQSSHVIPALIRKFVEARDSGAPRIECWGDGSPTREFLYVEEAAEGLILAAERYAGAAPINLGSGEEITIKALSEAIAALVNFRGEIRWDPARPNGQPRRRLDTQKAANLFQFTAKVQLDEGLRRSVAWFEERERTPKTAEFHEGPHAG